MISLILVFVLVISFSNIAVYAKNDKSNNVFVDGVEYNVSIKNDFEITVKAVDKNINAKMVIGKK